MKNKPVSPLRLIRAKCLECAGGRGAVRKCQEAKCALHGLRMGRNPNRQGIGRPGGNPLLNRPVRLRFHIKTGILEAVSDCNSSRQDS